MLSESTRYCLLALLALACGDPPPVPAQEDVPLPVAARDSSVRSAAAALAAGHPWLASQRVRPALADSARRTPEAVLLAARAAAGWGGWDEVERLLEGAVWLDEQAGGHGRELLTRAALARGADTLALERARAAVRDADDPETEGVRLVLLARALDRLDQRDSARVAYARAAELLPWVDDWLHLRAAGVSADSATRWSHLSRVSLPAARDRVERVDATTREKTGDLEGAARAYAAIGEPANALRVRLLAGPDSVARDAIRGELARLVAGGPAADARAAAELLTTEFGTLTAGEELAIGRRLADIGPVARAAQGFARGLAGGRGTAEDRYRYGVVLARLNRDREAAAQFARVTAPASLADDAAYQRARANLALGQRDRARSLLRGILREHPNGTMAPTALFLLGDMATDEQRDEAARSAFRDIVRTYPRSARVDDARFRAATIAYALGRHRQAALEFDSLRTLHPRSGEATAATYWAGRAWAALGDTARAGERWRAVMTSNPMSYYTSLSARRLGVEPWAPPPAADSFPAVAAVDSAIGRAALLARLGMDLEEGFEYARLERDAPESTDRLLATAAALRGRSEATRAIRLAWKAIEAGAPRDARSYRLAYPLARRDVLVSEARARDLDPAFVAALIRQESSFNPRATSAAGARGLMQVMPALGRTLARAAGFPTWDPVLLYEPDVNLRFGMEHLADLARQYDELAHLLAAYNAGGSRVRRWREKRGVDDPEMFTERIPFVETRDYVRIVQRNADLYRALYEWERPTAAPTVPAP